MAQHTQPPSHQHSSASNSSGQQQSQNQQQSANQQVNTYNNNTTTTTATTTNNNNTNNNNNYVHGYHQMPGGVFMPATQVGGAMYSLAPPSSNVYVNNVTANVSLHGWHGHSGQVPNYISANTPFIPYTGDLPAGAVTGPHVMEPQMIQGSSTSLPPVKPHYHHSRRQRSITNGRGGGNNAGRNNRHIEFQRNDASPVPAENPVEGTYVPFNVQYTYPSFYSVPSQQMPSNHLAHHAHQATGPPIYLTPSPMFAGQIYNYSSFVYPQIMHQDAYQPILDERGIEIEHQPPQPLPSQTDIDNGIAPVNGAVHQQLWQPQMVMEYQNIDAPEYQDSDDINHNHSGGTSVIETSPNMLSPASYHPIQYNNVNSNLPIEIHQQMNAMHLYDPQQAPPYASPTDHMVIQQIDQSTEQQEIQNQQDETNHLNNVHHQQYIIHHDIPQHAEFNQIEQDPNATEFEQVSINKQNFTEQNVFISNQEQLSRQPQSPLNQLAQQPPPPAFYPATQQHIQPQQHLQPQLHLQRQQHIQPQQLQQPQQPEQQQQQQQQQQQAQQQQQDMQPIQYIQPSQLSTPNIPNNVNNVILTKEFSLVTDSDNCEKVPNNINNYSASIAGTAPITTSGSLIIINNNNNNKNNNTNNINNNNNNNNNTIENNSTNLDQKNETEVSSIILNNSVPTNTNKPNSHPVEIVLPVNNVTPLQTVATVTSYPPTKSLSWTNQLHQKKSTASVAVTALPTSKPNHTQKQSQSSKNNISNNKLMTTSVPIFVPQENRKSINTEQKSIASAVVPQQLQDTSNVNNIESSENQNPAKNLNNLQKIQEVIPNQAIQVNHSTQAQCHLPTLQSQNLQTSPRTLPATQATVQSQAQHQMNLAPPPTANQQTNQSTNGQPQSWASLFATANETKSQNSKNLSSLTSQTTINNKKPIAKVLPFDSTTITSNSIESSGNSSMQISYSSVSSQNIVQNSAPLINVTPSLKPSNDLQDEWSTKFADFLKKYKTDYTEISLRPRGITNPNNYCYINAILQALIGCSPLYNLLKALPKQSPAMLESRIKIPTIQIMQQLANEFSHLPTGIRLISRREREKSNQKISNSEGDLQVDPAFEATSIYKLWNESRCGVDEGRQGDAEEFLSFVLNKLNDEMLEVTKLLAKPEKKIETSNENDDGGDDWQMIYNNRNKGSVTRQTDFGKTPISDIFRGELRSRLQREGELSTDVIQPFFTLQLNIEKAASVREALEILVGRDQIEGVTCSKTNQEVVAWQQMNVEKLPAILILHLKWFDYKLDGCTKIVKNVEFPKELKIDTKILASKKYSQNKRLYRLFAVVYHDGKQANKGHYISDVYHEGYSNWLRYDDIHVKPLSESNVLKPKGLRVPYLLYYRRYDTISQSNQNSK